MSIFFAVVVAIIFMACFIGLFDNNEKERKRWGLDEYRIQMLEYYSKGKVQSIRYFVEQRLSIPMIGKVWKPVKEYQCGYSDCSWETIYFDKQSEAEALVESLREGNKCEGHIETTIKKIP
jgi:hypothetical protein